MARTAPSVALATILGIAPFAAHAAVTGHCTYEGNKHALVDGAVWQIPPDPDDADDEPEDWDGDGEPDPPDPPKLMLTFTSFKIDAGAVQRATDREDAMRDQSFAADDSAKLELTLQPGEGVTQQYLWISPGQNLSYSSDTVGEYKARTAGKNRMAGHYKYSDDDAEGPHCDIDFDVAVIGSVADAPPLPPPPGKPLPTDGGEPGKVYLALNKAMIAGDLDALATLLAPAQAAEMQKARATPDFAAQLALMQAMTAHNVKIKSGRIDGDKAWLEFDATEGDALRSGSVEMVREEGRWRVVNESTRDRDK